jgi:hypothetical protein
MKASMVTTVGYLADDAISFGAEREKSTPVNPNRLFSMDMEQ